MVTENTTSFHNDNRGTVVLIDNKVYELVPSERWTFELLSAEPTATRPHARTLTPIPVRSKAEQAARNKESAYLDELCDRIPKGRNTPLSKVKAAVSRGGKLPEEIQSLLEKKEAALAAGDIKEAKRIRKALRALDYRRYQGTDNKEE